MSAIRDRSKVEAFARELAGMVGVEIDDARAEVRRAAAAGPTSADRAPGRRRSAGERPAAPLPDLRDPRFSLERETLKLVVQHPEARRPAGRRRRRQRLHPPDVPRASGSWSPAAGGADAPAGECWVRQAARQRHGPGGRRRRCQRARRRAAAHDSRAGPGVRRRARLPAAGGDRACGAIADLKSKLQRTNPVEQATEYNRMFGDLVALEQHRRNLRERAIGGDE